VVTRDGRKVTQLVKFEGIDSLENIRGVINQGLYSWYSDGRYRKGQDHYHDLFLRKIAPELVTVWLNYYEDGNPYPNPQLIKPPTMREKITKLIEDYKEEISAYNVMEFPEAAIWAIPEASIPLLATAIEKLVRAEAEKEAIDYTEWLHSSGYRKTVDGLFYYNYNQSIEDGWKTKIETYILFKFEQFLSTLRVYDADKKLYLFDELGGDDYSVKTTSELFDLYKSEQLKTQQHGTDTNTI